MQKHMPPSTQSWSHAPVKELYLPGLCGRIPRVEIHSFRNLQPRAGVTVSVQAGPHLVLRPFLHSEQVARTSWEHTSAARMDTASHLCVPTQACKSVGSCVLLQGRKSQQESSRMRGAASDVAMRVALSECVTYLYPAYCDGVHPAYSVESL